VARTPPDGFGRNEASTHNHNAHNGFISDGANNSYHFPGTFFDYHWGTTLARAEKINTGATDRRASGPDDNGGLNLVPGDYRELQNTLWYHDHRFFFTAENVYKGHVGMLNYYSGPDRGNETIKDGVNLQLPSGRLLSWGNIDFDVNLMVSDFATSEDGQLFFDIFNTDGFLGDNLLVNHTYKPFMEVLPRKYRFRILSASMSRFIQLAVVNASGTAVPIRVICNDGNFLVNPVTVTQLDVQGVAERFDVIVDFSPFKVGDKLRLVNVLQHQDGRGPDKTVTIADALGGRSSDPAVGAIMEFRIASSVPSVDVPGVTLRSTDKDNSLVPARLTDQIPVVTPVRERTIEFTRGGGEDPRLPGVCMPDCEGKDSFPWSVKVNGQSAHSANANRISVLVPKPGEIEHWTIINGGGGWDHPIHLHFEEGVTIDRGGDTVPLTERLVRKDVWRLRRGGRVKFQVQFGEYGGAYVNHCHNTVHEDAAMLLRYQILRNDDGTGNPLVDVTPTPRPTPDGVEFVTPEILPEGDPRRGSV
jgi:FtsP/CotA-like multicopper oxidase with cupredoxin domain